MADILIRGMEMPESCDKCNLFDGCWCMALGIGNWRKSYSKPEQGERLPDCPLVPLPAGHGDLIDRDALRADNGLNAKCEHCPTNTYECQRDMIHTKMEFCEMLDDTPVIVPAEGGTDDVRCL